MQRSGVHMCIAFVICKCRDAVICSELVIYIDALSAQSSVRPRRGCQELNLALRLSSAGISR